MANPHRVPGDEDRDRTRSYIEEKPPNADDLEKESWRERYPGWETLHGKPNDPRFEGLSDPNKDERYNTNLRGAAVLPGTPGATVWVWFAFLGLIMGVLFGLLMFWHFQTPSPRAPKQAQVQAAPIRDESTVVADSLLPLRTRYRPRLE